MPLLPAGPKRCRVIRCWLGSFGAALAEPVAVAVHLKDVDVVGEAVEEGPGQVFRVSVLIKPLFGPTSGLL